MNSKDDIHDWNKIATAYADRVNGSGDRCIPEIREHFWNVLGDLQGKKILDVGCGTGWLTNELSLRGAEAIGIDGAKELLKHARVTHPQIEFMEFNLEHGLPALDGLFDVVVSHMVVMDIPRIDRLLIDIGRVLTPGGLFIMTLPHPCFFMQKSQQDANGVWFKKLTGYLRHEVWRIESFGGHNHYHRTISDYINTLRSAHMYVCDFHEPPHQAKGDKVDPAFLRTIPIFLMITAKRLIEPGNPEYSGSVRDKIETTI